MKLSKICFLLMASLLFVGCKSEKEELATQMVEKSGIIDLLKENPQGAMLLDSISEKELTNIYAEVYASNLSMEEMRHSIKFNGSSLGRKTMKFNMSLAERINVPCSVLEIPANKVSLATEVFSYDKTIHLLNHQQKQNAIAYCASEFSEDELTRLRDHMKKPVTQSISSKIIKVMQDAQLKIMNALQS